jgi:hypothetical protein
MMREDFKVTFSDSIVVNVHEHEPYEGSYNVTPSDVLQTLPTFDKYMKDIVVVQPIPSKYVNVSYDRNTKILRIR